MTNVKFFLTYKRMDWQKAYFHAKFEANFNYCICYYPILMGQNRDIEQSLLHNCNIEFKYAKNTNTRF